MRWLVVVMLAFGVAHADPSGFAHRIHDLKLTTAGKESLPCASCHATSGGRLVGKPGHATCMTAACHAPKPTSGKLCDTCHDAGSKKAFYPPYAIDRDFRVQLGHAAHGSTGCATCHTKAKPAPHARCIGCHDGRGIDGRPTFAMAACEKCHAPGGGDPQPPSLMPAVYKMKSFSHARHGKDCASCHAAIAQSNDQFLPRPNAKTCAGCHDIVARCTLCHTEPGPIAKREVLRFRHQTHAPMPCAGCHAVKGNEVVSTGHAACATCHAEDFGSRTPKICLACHSSIEPWRHLIVDRLPPASTEFGADLAHGKHAQLACATCHSLTTATHQLRAPRGHAACSGCHDKQAPTLDQCEACHRAGLQAQRDIARRAAAWSVRPQFQHGKHAQPCTECHGDTSAPSVLQLATPPKAACARCHDGKTSFALTGTTCTRCHVGL